MTLGVNIIQDISGNFVNIKFFSNFLKFFFQRFTQSFDKVTAEISPNFCSDLLKNFLASFRSIVKLSLNGQII